MQHMNYRVQVNFTSLCEIYSETSST